MSDLPSEPNGLPESPEGSTPAAAQVNRTGPLPHDFAQTVAKAVKVGDAKDERFYWVLLFVLFVGLALVGLFVFGVL